MAIDSIKTLGETTDTVQYLTLSAATQLAITSIDAGIVYTTSAPTAANTNGIKICVLSSEPATKYSGWLYLITS